MKEYLYYAYYFGFAGSWVYKVHNLNIRIKRGPKNEIDIN